MTEQDLENKINKIYKIENDENLAMLKGLSSSKRDASREAARANEAVAEKAKPKIKHEMAI